VVNKNYVLFEILTYSGPIQWARGSSGAKAPPLAALPIMSVLMHAATRACAVCVLQAVNARERELLAAVNQQHSSRQAAVDNGLHVCEQTWRALTQLQAAMSSDDGHHADDQDFLLEFNTQLALLSHIPDLPSIDFSMCMSSEQALATVQQLSFATGDDALHMAWKEKNLNNDVATSFSRQADLR